MGWPPAAPSRRRGPHGQVWHGTAMGTVGAAREHKQLRLLDSPFPDLLSSTWSPTVAQKYLEIFDTSARFASEDRKDFFFFFLTFQHEIQIKF